MLIKERCLSVYLWRLGKSTARTSDTHADKKETFFFFSFWNCYSRIPRIFIEKKNYFWRTSLFQWYLSFKKYINVYSFKNIFIEAWLRARFQVFSFSAFMLPLPQTELQNKKQKQQQENKLLLIVSFPF